MKKSSIFKILTLFLTFVIFSCCSGCFLSFVAYTNEKELQELLEIERQRKEQADALIPEVEGYTFEALPEVAFANQEDWESQGFLKGSNFFEKYQADEYILDVIEYEDGSKKFTIRNLYDSNDLNESEKYVITSPEQEQKYGSNFPIFTAYNYIVCNGESFILRWMETVWAGTQREGSGTCALFLVDFENHTLYYAGYSKGWIEAELNDNRLYNFNRICFKLTKN